MSYSNRRAFLVLLAATPIAACGFQPIYRDGSVARNLEGNLRFNLIDGREGFDLLERLESRFGAPGASARYDVIIDLAIDQTGLILTASSGLTRYTVTGKVTLTVMDRTLGEQVFDDRLRNTTGYSGDAETLATVSSQRDAYRRVVLALADQIALRLSSTAGDWAK